MNMHVILARGSRNTDCYTHARVWVAKNEQLAGNKRHVKRSFVPGRFSLAAVIAKAQNTDAHFTKTRFIHLRVLIILI